MKKVWIIFILAIFGLFLTKPMQAGSIGDPGASLSKGSGSLGPEISWVGREIRDREGMRYDTEAWRLLLKGSYGITDRLEVFGRLGGATLKIRGTAYDGSSGVAGGAGLKATFLDPPNHPLGYSLGGQFFYTQPGDGGADANWFEYDIWAGISCKKRKDFIPYGGIIYSRVNGKLKNFPLRPMLDDFESPTAAGIFLGLDWQINQKTKLGFELRGGSENSGTFSLSYRF